MTIRNRNIWQVIARSLAVVFLIGTSAAVAADSPTESRVIKLAGTDTPQRISLSLNKAAIIELDRDARDVIVANPTIVDAVVRTPRRIFILSLKVGETNAIFMDAAGRQIGTLDITVGTDVNDLNTVMSRNMPGTNVRAQALNDGIVVSGNVNSLPEAKAAQDMAARLAGTPDKVVNMLQINQRHQVLIKVRVSEMQRSVSKQLGVNVQAALPRAEGVPLLFNSSNAFSLLGRALSDLSGLQIGRACPTPYLALAPCDSVQNNAQGVVQALERIGLVHTLAEPNLTAVSGESAKFLAGGEFPVPGSRDQYGNPIIEWKEFGVGLAFTPVVLSDGRISLFISTEVSELSQQNSLTSDGSTQVDGNGNLVNIKGLTIPGLTVRRTQTTVELPSGGSLMIGGLLHQDSRQNLDAFPGLKDLPVLGALFRSRDFRNNETELVVMVTAYLVDPVQQQQLATPSQGFVLPSDAETVLLGRLNSVYGKENAVPTTVPKGSIGYIVQ